MACLPGIRLALADYGPDDTPDVTPRPLSQLVEWADDASRFCDETRFSLAGRDVAALITESQAYAATATGADRTRAYGALVTACMVAGAIAKNLGNIDLSSTAARRGYAFARRADDHGLIGFVQWYWALGLMRCQGTMRLAARRRTLSVLTAGVDELTPAVTLRHTDTTLPAEMVGLVRLTSAHTESRERRSDEAHSTPGRGSRPRTGRRRDTPQCRALVLASPRPRPCLGADGGPHDTEAVRHLDAADRAAPQRIRPDPMARDLVATLDRRARRRVWELDSLRNRFGVN